jgi:hypothetical protein
MPENVSFIYSGAFKNAVYLERITLNDGLSSIGSSAFAYIPNLSYIYIPASVTTVEQNILDGDSSAIIYCEAASLPGGWNYSWQGSHSGSVIWDCKNNSSTQNDVIYVTVEGVRYIISGDTASVSDNQSSTLTIANILASVTYNGSDYPVTEIVYGAFGNAKALETVIIPESITKISAYAFGNCKNLSKIYYNASLPADHGLAFASDIGTNTDGLTVYIGKNVTAICNSMFSGTSSLTELIFEDESSCTYVGSNAFTNCALLKSITLPKSVTTIEKKAFSGCASLESISLPDGLTTLSVGIFYECTSLATVEIPESVVSLASNAFYGCTALESVIISKNVSSIYKDAFKNCSSLRAVYYVGDAVQWINIYIETPFTMPVYVNYTKN